LGLAICTSFVNLMKGNIWLESTEGLGSTFYFTLPLKVQAGKKNLSSFKQIDLKEMRTLIVDDNDINREILKKILKSWEIKTTSIKNGFECINELERVKDTNEDYQLILLDQHMPGMDGFELMKRLNGINRIKEMTIIMLSSADQLGDIKRCKDLGITSYLTKPINPSELMNTIIGIINKKYHSEDNTIVKEESSKIESPELMKKLNILLAEDNEVNCMLALKLLEKIGLNVTTANNGLIVLELLEKNKFDLILMDVQMPDMNGIEATKLIRNKEKDTNEHLPIIALTAHAMQGDKERFIGLGMDDYLSKPLDPKQLYNLISKYAKQTRYEHSFTKYKPDENNKQDNPPNKMVFLNINELNSRLDGDEVLGKELLKMYSEELSEMMNEVLQAIETNDANNLNTAAHKLKGASATVSAEGIRNLAFKLEKIGEINDLSNAKKIFSELSRIKNKTLFNINEYLRNN
ncbi:MAG: response regulator, partial [Candidatus Thorarchaeota archaeon]